VNFIDTVQKEQYQAETNNESQNIYRCKLIVGYSGIKLESNKTRYCENRTHQHKNIDTENQNEPEVQKYHGGEWNYEVPHKARYLSVLPENQN